MVALTWAWYFPAVETAHDLYDVHIPSVPSVKYEGLAFLNDGAPITTPLTLTHAANAASLNEFAMEYPLSPEFIRVMTSQELQDRIVSATAAYFSLRDPVYVAEVDMTVMLFYRDQQDCMMWYLVLDGPLEGHVIASPVHVEEVNVDDEGPAAVVQYWTDNIVVCARSFPEFLYRTWIENQIWFQQNEPTKSPPPFVVHECAWEPSTASRKLSSPPFQKIALAGRYLAVVTEYMEGGDVWTYPTTLAWYHPRTVGLGAMMQQSTLAAAMTMRVPIDHMCSSSRCCSAYLYALPQVVCVVKVKNVLLDDQDWLAT
ncbi:hypothetical protein DYB38_001855 [Aphanomyces astaci]|uniref:Uncharacterized protein n=1 Tax=Aphanomyces astaci TaxID=112090 RepID=A0A397CQ15_APHAT|nr:hypothetical protein DYB38_001855 [Aphanomyces astaci]